ncbi:MAG: NfeD family protein [Eubacteriales bacterium]
MSGTIIWLMVFIALALIEVGTMGLATIWFAIGAFVAMVSAMLGAGVFVQRSLFIVVSLLMLIFTRPLAVKYFNRERRKTNIDAIVGQEGIVTSQIDNLKAMGSVMVKGKEWTARVVEHNQIIHEGSVVIVKAIEGVKLIVEERKEEN